MSNPAQYSARMQIEVALVTKRLAQALAASLPEGEASDVMAFLLQRAAVLDDAPGATPEATLDAIRERGPTQASQRHPLDRVIDAFRLNDFEAALLILAGLPEEHEGFAAVLRSLHARNEPWMTVGLAARAFNESQRELLRELLISGSAVSNGLLRLQGEVPFFEKSLCLMEGLWPALHGIERWPNDMELWPQSPSTLSGLHEWFTQSAAQRALRALSAREPSTILLSGASDDALLWRGLALATQAQRRAVAIAFKTSPDAARQQLIQAHAVVRDCVTVLLYPDVETSGAPAAAIGMAGIPDTMIVCTRHGNAQWHAPRPLLALSAEPLNSLARRNMWEQMLPELRLHAASLAARFPMEPAHADLLSNDLRAIARLDQRPLELEDVFDGMRARAGLQVSAAIKLVKPQASWNDLVIPAARLNQLQEAVNRLCLQMRVLDEWGFLKTRAGSRGVRMLFSGSPGTGKTLSAEVMANALCADLLVVDLSRVVSKWIGETEKNLSNVFDSAERARAVLFFDEADALFCKRTEVSDAHDRYANLETAYLLQRLERFDGLAILATNLKQNIDSAFMRRLEFVIEFNEPDREQRQRLWRTHIPVDAPLAVDVNLSELAAVYAVTGGVVRNAAVAAAFLAASDGTEITQYHLVRAVRREYEKAGKAFPGSPAGMAV